MSFLNDLFGMDSFVRSFVLWHQLTSGHGHGAGRGSWFGTSLDVVDLVVRNKMIRHMENGGEAFF